MNETNHIYLLYLRKRAWFLFLFFLIFSSFPGGSEVKASAWNAGDPGSIPGSGRSPGKGNGSPLQYSCLENPMDWGAWWAAVHGVTKSWTRLSDFTYLLYLVDILISLILQGVSISKQLLARVLGKSFCLEKHLQWSPSHFLPPAFI